MSVFKEEYIKRRQQFRTAIRIPASATRVKKPKYSSSLISFGALFRSAKEIPEVKTKVRIKAETIMKASTDLFSTPRIFV